VNPLHPVSDSEETSKPTRILKIKDRRIFFPFCIITCHLKF
jgi:hypothetical protein